MKAVALLSGGLDSVTATALAHAQGAEIHALSVRYGQRHSRELACAKRAAEKYAVTALEISIDIPLPGSALTGTTDLPTTPATQPDATYVPARNTILLALGAARAEALGAGEVIIGANADDAAGYPDCRYDYLLSMQRVLDMGTITQPQISAPWLNCTKAEVLQRAIELGVDLADTWSCYAGGTEPCGQCGACITRRDAFAACNATDPLVAP